VFHLQRHHHRKNAEDQLLIIAVTIAAKDPVVLYGSMMPVKTILSAGAQCQFVAIV